MKEPSLDPRAARAAEATRDIPESPCPLRTAFQRDRDRIIHTKAFRRLKHKTQVFISPEGDHYRTRLTHTLEVSAIGRTVARAMGLNEDLVEAITMGHDLGHAPFGHAGEHALDDFLRESVGRRFLHNEQSVRVVEVIERDGQGLNLTREVRDGIRNHTGDGVPATLEGQIVRLVDRIAYVNHDIDDATRAGIIRPADLPREEIAVLGPTTSARITRLVTDIVETSGAGDVIVQSAEVGEAFRSLRTYMFDFVYLASPAADEARRARYVVQGLVRAYLDDPGLLPLSHEVDLVTRVTDFVSGMTDRYALRVYGDLFIPHEGPL
ncbi:MAG: deoxyguanosinetriphosphate triphosphohydrolase [Thermoleophilia bacterium]|nr:deoxyguanosinetriphosphate triphosphohydrolase [Thermoleophilia bacterium]